MYPLKMCRSTLFTWWRLKSLAHNSRAPWCPQALLPWHHRSSNMSSTVRLMCFVQRPLCLGWSTFLNYQNSSRGLNLASTKHHLWWSPAFQSDQTELTTPSSEVQQHLTQAAVRPLTSLYLVTMNFHVCVSPPEAKHLEVVPLLGMNALPKVEGPECTATLLHRFLSNAGCKGSIRLPAWQNHIGEVTPQSSRQDNSSCHIGNVSSEPGTATRAWRASSHFILAPVLDIGEVLPFLNVATKALKSFSNLLSKHGEVSEVQVEVWEHASKQP